MQTHLVLGAVLLLATAAASSADEPKSVLGQVLDAAGVPVAGASVSAFNSVQKDIHLGGLVLRPKAADLTI